MQRNLLELHFIALRQCLERLRPGGVGLHARRSPSLGGLPETTAAGFRASFLTYGWKVQAEPESVLAAHAAMQRDGFGPFQFYRADLLAERFANLDPVTSGRHAFEVEDALGSARIDASSAYELFRRGVAIGHTVVVLESEAA